MEPPIEGVYSIEEIAKMLSISEGTARNKLTKWKKEGYARKFLNKYDLSKRRKFLEKRSFLDYVNKRLPNHMKLALLKEINVHGDYSYEHALVDLIKSGEIRKLLASMFVFNDIKDYSLLVKLAKKYEIANIIGAMYVLARLFFRTKKIPKRYLKLLKKQRTFKKISSIPSSHEYPEIEKEWNVSIPFTKRTFMEAKYA